MKRRSFLKLFSAAPIAAAVPAGVVAALQEATPATTTITPPPVFIPQQWADDRVGAFYIRSLAQNMRETMDRVVLDVLSRE